MLFGITAVICAVLAGNGGFSQAVIDLSHVQAETNPDLQGAFVSMFGPDLLHLLGVVVLTSLGTWGLPQMVQKFYAIKSGPAIKQGAIISTIFAMVVAGGSYFLGSFGRLYSGQIEMSAAGTPIYDSIIPTMLSTLPDFARRSRNRARAFGLDVDLELACAHLVEHAHARLAERQRREEHG